MSFHPSLELICRCDDYLPWRSFQVRGQILSGAGRQCGRLVADKKLRKSWQWSRDENRKRSEWKKTTRWEGGKQLVGSTHLFVHSKQSETRSQGESSVFRLIRESRSTTSFLTKTRPSFLGFFKNWTKGKYSIYSTGRIRDGTGWRWGGINGAFRRWRRRALIFQGGSTCIGSSQF